MRRLAHLKMEKSSLTEVTRNWSGQVFNGYRTCDQQEASSLATFMRLIDLTVSADPRLFAPEDLYSLCSSRRSPEQYHLFVSFWRYDAG